MLTIHPAARPAAPAPPKPPVVVGIDPSTNTGVVVLRGSEVLSQNTIVFPDLKGIERVYNIAFALSSILEAAAAEGTIAGCFLEGYALHNKFTLATLVEVGTAIRLVLHTRKLDWFSINPTSLKLWGAGSGTADKGAMRDAALARWKFTAEKRAGVKTDDVVDAFILAKMGQAFLAGDPTMSAASKEEVEKIPFRFAHLGCASKK